MHNKDEILQKINELMKANPGIVKGGYGYKIKNGQMTDDLAIVCSVKEKKSLSELAPNEVIPSQVELSSGTIRTDVNIVTEVKALVCNAACGEAYGPNSVTNRSKLRPLQGGISITSRNKVSTVGTMGFIGVHAATNTFVGVTNNHVTIQDAFYTSERNLGGVRTNEYSPIDYIYQDGETAGIPPLNYRIGQSLRYVPIHEWDGFKLNYVDGAIFSLQDKDSDFQGLVDIYSSFKQAGETYSSPLPFATTAEIDNLMITNPMLYSSGRTTGPKGGINCPMRVKEIHVISDTKYLRQGVEVVCRFADLIEFVKPVNDPSITTVCANPVMGGDSGSALIADFGGTRKIIGIVYAGGGVDDTFYFGYACRIDRVAQELGIVEWDGSSRLYVNPTSIEYKTTPGGSSNKILSCGGKNYWQVGLITGNNNPC